DITSSKLIGLRRFFQHYNLPKVLLCLFRKVLELQNQLRTTRTGLMANGSHASLSLGGGGSTPSAPGLSGSPSGSPGGSLLEGEVKQQLSLHGDGRSVSRRALQSYVEGLHLEVASSMVAQVVPTLLGLDMGETCDAKRFASLLASPPPWEQLDFATALWGAAGEPAANVVQQHRKKELQKSKSVERQGFSRASSSGSLGSSCRGPRTPTAACSPRRSPVRGVGVLGSFPFTT
ncbi:unnamed protein product, partial [Polarella glacialis]